MFIHQKPRVGRYKLKRLCERKPKDFFHPQFLLVSPLVDPFVFGAFVIFLVPPEEAVLHISNVLYDLLLHLAFTREELPVLEVTEHDGNQAHLLVWLEHKSKRTALFRLHDEEYYPVMLFTVFALIQ